MGIKPGDLIFILGNSFIDKAIEHVTHGPSHVAMFLDYNTLIEAQGGREVGTNNLSFYSSKKCEVWTDPTLTDDERKQMIQYALSLQGTPYDYLLDILEFGHFEWGANINWFKESGHLICSTFVNKVGQRVNRAWSKVVNPAPVDLLEGGILIRKES